MRVFTSVIALILLLVSTLFPYESSTSVYSSEDELDEALRLGEINYSQYLILQEIITHGVDSTNRHLLDEIPNLMFFLTDRRSLVTALEKEQALAFSKPIDKAGRPLGKFGYKYYQELKREERERYRISYYFYPTNHFEVAFRLHREYSGKERFVSRRIVYRNRQNRLQELTLGNFTRRLGLGTILGYRGKLLEFSNRIDEESFLFPDYGGYNGLYSRVKYDNVEAEVLASVNRDGHHTLVSAGGMFSLAKSPLKPGVIVSVSCLKNRKTDQRHFDFKYGLYSRYRYRQSYLSLEICAQDGEQSTWGGLVTEGRHRFGGAEIRYAGWVYTDEYIDLTSGSKSGNLRHADTLYKVDFAYSEKRSGQEGGMLKSIVLLAHDFEIINSILYAGRNKDTADIQFLSGLVRKLNQDCEIRFDYLNKTKKRVKEWYDQRTRIEARIRTGKFSVRSYIAYNTKSSRRDYVSFFVNLKYRSHKVGSLEIWSNLARFDLRYSAIDYWYIYIKNEQQLFSGVAIAMKLSHSYDRNPNGEHRTVILLELRAAL